ncbi:hypothetical protein ACEWX3_07550 [Mycobacterium sp. G7A2]|uniref:glycine-rich domain-containing protein n=1 Tax=Mycobacterium sp. G7A2 TaxID=3317307 RepID=UPI0035A969BA
MPVDDHNPLANLLDFNDIDSTAAIAGDSIRLFINGLLDGVVDFINDLTGINLESWDAFIASLFDGKGIDLGWIATAVSDVVDDLSDLISDLLTNPVEVIGNLVSSMIPGLDASKITSGSFPQTMINGLLEALANLLPWNIFRGTQRSGASMLFDPSVEDDSLDAERALGFNGSSGVFSHSTEQAHTGTRSVKHVAAGTGFPFIRMTPGQTNNNDFDNFFSVQAGRRYFISQWVYSPVSNAGTGNTALYLEFRLSTDPNNVRTWVAASSSNPTKGQWVQQSGYVTVPAGYDRMGGYFASVRPENTAGDVFYFDDFEMYEVTESQNIVQRIFGGVGSLASTILTAVIPGLDTSKITSGTFAQSMISGLSTALSNIWDDITEGAQNFAQLVSDLLNNPVEVISNLVSSMIPGLDASKITSGTFAQTMISGLIDALASLLPWNIFKTRERAGTNLVPDPSMEDPAFDANRTFSNTSGEAVMSTEQAHSGTRSVKMTYQDSYPTFYHTPFESLGGTISTHMAVQPGQKFYCSAWVYGHPGNTGNNLIYITSARTSQSATGSHVAWLNVSGNAIAGQWTKIEGYITVPAGADRLQLGTSLRIGMNPGDVIYVDDLEVREVTESQNIVQRIFGGVGSTVTSILSAVIPGLDASKITSGVFPQAMVNITTIAANVIEGVLDIARIPGLAASKIISGLFGPERIGIRDYENLLGSGGFEDDAHGWGLTATEEIATDQTHTGARSLKFLPGSVGISWAGGASEASGTIDVREGEQLYCEAWVRKTADFAAADARLRMGAKQNEVDGGINMSNMFFRPGDIPTADEWHKVTYTSPAYPAGTIGINPRIFISNMTAGALWVDDIVIRRVKKESWIDNLPGGKIISTLLSSVIPGLDASKIISGSFSQAIVSGLDGIVKWLRAGFTSGPTNLAADSSFESDLWGGVRSSEQAHSGIYSLKLVGADSYVTATLTRDESFGITNISVIPGDKYYIEGWIYPHVDNVQTTGSVQNTVLRFEDSRGVNSVTYISAGAGVNGLTKGQWNKVSTYATVPAGYDLMRAYVQVPNNIQAGEVFYFDDIVIREVTESQNIVQRIFGAIGSTANAILSAVIPGLDTSKITSGTFAQSMISGLTTALSNLLPWNWFVHDRRAGTNLVFSPDFEDTTVARQKYSTGTVLAYSTEQAHSGTRSLKITAQASNWDGISLTALPADAPGYSRYFKVQAGEKYRVSAWVRAHAGNNNSSGGNVRLFLRWSSSSGTPSGYLDSGAAAGADHLVNNDELAAGGWFQIHNVGTCPTDRDQLEVMLLNDTSTPAGNIYYFDDVEVREVTESQNIIEKIFGGIGTTLSNIVAAVIPGLDASKITSGIFPQSMVNITDVAASVISGVLDVARIPGLAASKIVSGLLGTARIPGLDASKITSGVFSQSMVNITDVAASVISGVLDVARIPGLAASKIISGIFGSSLIPGLDASKITGGTFSQSMVNGLTTALSDAATNLQSLINQIWTGVSRQTLDDDKDLPDLFDVLGNIPAISVGGIGGMASIADTITETWTQLWGGLAREIGEGKSIADAANAAAVVADNADTAVQLGEWNNAILGIRNNNGWGSGMDPTAVAMFPLPGSTTNNLSQNPQDCYAKPAEVPIAFWLAEEDALIGSVCWYGKGTSGITAFYVDVYRMNYDTQTMEFLHSSHDLYPQLTNDWKCIRYNMASADRVQVAHGDVLAIAFRPQGSGTAYHSMACQWAGWLPADTSQAPARPSARRTATVGDLAFNAIDYAGHIPWAALGIVEGDVPPPYYAPRTVEITSQGTGIDYDIPTWANYLDVVIIGGGGGGKGGNGGTTQPGYGGEAGTWQTETLVRGVDFPVGATQIIFDVGPGGAGGAKEQNGSAGTATVRRAITGGKAALSAAGGAGATQYGWGSDPMRQGRSPGNMTYQGRNYVGGLGGNGGAPGEDGSAPGAGGGGGNGGIYTIAYAGGDGARGRAWITARQSA